MNGNHRQFPREAIEALERGQYIDAVKCVRTATGLGLKEAKSAVEEVLKGDTSLQLRHDAARKKESLSGAIWTVAIVVIAAIAYALIFGKR